MKNKIYFSEKLKLNFKFKKDNAGKRVIVFEDGINYRNNEVEKIKNCNDTELKNIHSLKKTFKGFIL
jgi:hypothetical protein